MTDPAQPFDIDRYLTFPRLSGLRLSPDGSRLVVSVSTPAPDGKKMASSLWQVDPAGAREPRRLTRSAKGESGAAFLPDGGMLFTSARPDPDAKEDADEDRAGALWLLPRDGGEARLLLSPKAGIDAISCARDARRVAFGTQLFPGTSDLGADAERAKARKDAGVEALLFEDYPISFWDHYLGPQERRVLVADVAAAEDEPLGPTSDLLPDVGHRLEDTGFDLTPDGSTAIVVVHDLTELARPASVLVAVDVRTGARRTLTERDAWFEEPACSPDGRWVASAWTGLGTPEHAGRASLWLVDLATGEGRPLAAEADLRPHGIAWSADAQALFFLSDDHGRTSAFRYQLASGELTRLVADGTLSDLCPSPDGSTVYALRSTLRTPPHVVRFASRGVDQRPEILRSPAPSEETVAAPGRVERLVAAATDGTAIESWLMLPPGASAEHPAPLVVFVHGGPLGTWTDQWHWRWNPQLIVAGGYAVLMPDPAISTGYGHDFVQRGWGRWGMEPYTDVLAAVDAALERPDLDRERTALMGGSFGGYMANWVAGHTDRFRAIVTHASLWELKGFHGTTDWGNEWEIEFGSPYEDDRRYVENNPAPHIGRIRTPMLVIHGQLDRRVPVSEALELWTDLRRHGVDSKFLYFPDENHWVLKPQNARLWYRTVLAFLDQHVLGREWRRPDLV